MTKSLSLFAGLLLLAAPPLFAASPQEKALVATLRDKAYDVQRDAADPAHPIIVVRSTGFGGGIPDLTDADLKSIAGLKSLRSLDIHLFDAKQVTSEGLKQLAALNDLQTLNFDMATATDETMKAVATIQSLQTLNLAEHARDGRGPEGAGCPEVPEDSRPAGYVRDGRGMPDLAALSGLRRLNLHGCEGVTNKGLKELAALKDLKMLDIGETNVTPQGVARLQKALPNCKISHKVDD